MIDFERWQELNESYLGAALNWLRLRLAQMGGEGTDELAKANASMVHAITRAKQQESMPSLLILSERLGLSDFEKEVMLLCVAMELDTRISALCAKAKDNPNHPYPTFALAMALFEKPAWDALSPDRPLRFWRLIEINQLPSQPLVNSALHADERIVHFIKGMNYLDERLMPFLVPVESKEHTGQLPTSQQAMVEQIVSQIRQATTQRMSPVVQLPGSDVASKRMIARYVADLMGVQLYRLPVELIPSQMTELETLSRLWQRETNLTGSLMLYIDAAEVDSDEQIDLAIRFLKRSHGIFFVDVREVRQGLSPNTIAVDVSNPTWKEQHAAWAEALGSLAGDGPGLLAGQFNLDLSSIRQIAQDALVDPPENDGKTAQERAWDACLIRTRPRMDSLAQRIDTKATWDDIVLSQQEISLLHQIADQVRRRTTVYEDWGFRQKMNRGLGISALFTGESGTGKTMAAEVIANELRLNLYRIDLSQVVSKYIGETEKNLRRLFDAAEDGGAILFFDEADALFGKRSEVKDSHDRYANIEINYLLQRMESYRGLAILATNMKRALDPAFLRRLRFIVNFPFPNAAERRRIWKKVFPSKTPINGLEVERLARLNLTGGSIHNVALNAAFLAARNGGEVTMPLVLTASRMEFHKLERPVNESDFRCGDSTGIMA